jgi:hypothetical protein
MGLKEPRSRITSARWYVRMHFKWQFNYYKAPTVQNFVSVLRDITKRAAKVLPVENGSRIVEPALHCLRRLAGGSLVWCSLAIQLNHT